MASSTFIRLGNCGVAVRGIVSEMSFVPLLLTLWFAVGDELPRLRGHVADRHGHLWAPP